RPGSSGPRTPVAMSPSIERPNSAQLADGPKLPSATTWLMLAPTASSTSSTGTLNVAKPSSSMGSQSSAALADVVTASTLPAATSAPTPAAATRLDQCGRRRLLSGTCVISLSSSVRLLPRPVARPGDGEPPDLHVQIRRPYYVV